MHDINRERSDLCVALYEQKYTYTQIAEYILKRTRVMITRSAIAGYIQRAADRGEVARRTPPAQKAIRDACIDLAVKGKGYTETTIIIQQMFGVAINRNKVAGFVSRARGRGVDIPFKQSVKTFKAQTTVAKVRKGRVAAVKPLPALPAAPSEPEVPFELPEGVPTGIEAVLGLSKYTCAWPLGDPKDDTFRYCCAAIEPGGTYCGWHTRMGTVTRGEYRKRTDNRVGNFAYRRLA